MQPAGRPFFALRIYAPMPMRGSVERRERTGCLIRDEQSGLSPLSCSSFEPGEEELVEDFAIDAAGCASRKPAYDAAGNLMYDGLYEHTYDACETGDWLKRSEAQTCLSPLSHEARVARPQRDVAGGLGHRYT